MVTGRPILREYPTSLHIIHWPFVRDSDPAYLRPAIKQILMNVPNLDHLRLATRESMTRYLIEDPRYPFRLRQLEMTPTRETIFVEFLRSQPEIEDVSFWTQDKLEGSSRWRADTTSLQPDILPKLRSIKSDETDISFLVPDHPVANLTLFEVLRSVQVHKEIGKSLVPLKRLTEHIELREQPWDSEIVSKCFPSLDFCWGSLSSYSLQLTPRSPELDDHSALSFLKQRGTRWHGLEVLRKKLSAFTALRKFNLSFYYHKYHDLTPEFCQTVPELSRFDVWEESCPSLEEVTLFGVTLIR
ncbi:hypothetical protein RSOL_460560 [Rhizoctonia solani AG-3 Rhs1AP]|uniref:F-box-like domain protein n=1 Tax=Rhizoctonia solani AG-3 Rhs1AP TaxID=1086054 RepID=X8JGK6_9AGAM|nr:hypothetical protein RSOL_460560 [Rhizoctonia solani AG-3 Rhs1AP]